MDMASKEELAETMMVQGNYARAYLEWKELIADFGRKVSSDRLEYWERQMEKCDNLR